MRLTEVRLTDLSSTNLSSTKLTPANSVSTNSTPTSAAPANVVSRKTTLALLLALATILSAAPPAAEKQLSVYAAVATYSVPVLQRSGHEYVGLLELLEPLGRVGGNASASHLKIRFDTIDAEFVAGRTRSKIHGRDFDLTAPFLIENSRGLVPVASLGGLLPRFLGARVDFHQSARRVFVGDVGIQPSFQLESAPQPHLTVNFSAPVDPTISTEPGKLHMIFRHDPVVSPGSQSISFDSHDITQATYSETDGAAELDVSANIPLIATFSNGGKTITLSAPPTATKAGTPSPSAVVTPPPQPQPTSPQPPSAFPNPPAPAPPRIVAVVDAAHGGDERGAALGNNLAEKDVTLGFARLLRHELEIRGFAVLMLRDSDTTLTSDQRAGTANAARAAAYICLHAVSQGSGARVYTALLPPEDLSKGSFRAWNSAQASALSLSQTIATAIADEMQKKQFSVGQSSASLRPLNNLLMPAIAVELAPGPNGISDLFSATYQQQAAAGVANALASVRDRLPVQP